MTDTVVVVEGDEPSPESAPVVVEESSPGNVETVAESVAESVGEAVAETVAAVEAGRAAETVSDAAGLSARMDHLEASVGELLALLRAQQEAPEPEPEVTVLEDDETVPDRAHPWFRSLDSWRGTS